MTGECLSRNARPLDSATFFQCHLLARPFNDPCYIIIRAEHTRVGPMLAERRSAARGPVSILAVTATAKTRSRDHGLAAWNRALSSYNLRQVQSLYFYETDRLNLLLWLCLQFAYAPSVFLCTALDFISIHCGYTKCCL